MPLVSDFMECKAFINFQGADGGGFSENYKINSTNYNTAMYDFALLLTKRSALLAYNWKIVHATQSLKLTKGDSSLPQVDETRPNPANYRYCSLPLLLDAEADLSADALCNDKEVGLLFSLDTGVGLRQNRLLRAIRDTWVNNSVSTLAHVDLAWNAVTTNTVGNDPSITAINNYLAGLLLYTHYFNKQPVAVPQMYDVLQWSEA